MPGAAWRGQQGLGSWLPPLTPTATERRPPNVPGRSAGQSGIKDPGYTGKNKCEPLPCSECLLSLLLRVRDAKRAGRGFEVQLQPHCANAARDLPCLRSIFLTCKVASATIGGLRGLSFGSLD